MILHVSHVRPRMARIADVRPGMVAEIATKTKSVGFPLRTQGTF